MRILIIHFLLTSCLIYYGSAAGNTKHELVSIGDTILEDATVRQKRSVPGGETQRDPNDPIYKNVAEARRLVAKQSFKSWNYVSRLIKNYIERQYSNLHITVDRSVSESIRTLRTRVSKQTITYYKVDAFAHVPNGDRSIFNCSVVFGSWFGKKPIGTNCIKVTYLMGRSEWVDPMNKQYLSFAEKSLQVYLKNAPDNGVPRDYRKYDVIVTFVKQGLAEGDVDYMNFVARWVHGNDDDPTVYICNSKVWEKLNGKIDILHAWCSRVSWNRGIN